MYQKILTVTDKEISSFISEFGEELSQNSENFDQKNGSLLVVPEKRKNLILY